jgi:hypothetical protein
MIGFIDTEYLDRSKIEILPVNFYSVQKIIDKGNNLSVKLYGTNKDLLFTKISNFRKDSYKNKIFGFCRTDTLEESVIAVSHDSHYDSHEYKDHLKYIKRNLYFENISVNPVQFDTFYEDGVINN